LNFLVLGVEVFPLHALTFACRLMVVLPCFNPLQETLSFFMISLQKLHARFHVCPFVLMCKVLWYAPCTNFVTPEVLVDDGICRSTADVQLIGSINDSNPSVLLNQSINSFKIVRRSWSVRTAIFVPLWNLYMHSYTFLFIIQFSPYCTNIILRSSGGFILSDHNNIMTSRWSTVVQSESWADMFTLWLQEIHWT
jgi:hypothetical protein